MVRVWRDERLARRRFSLDEIETTLGIEVNFGSMRALRIFVLRAVRLSWLPLLNTVNPRTSDWG